MKYIVFISGLMIFVVTGLMILSRVRSGKSLVYEGCSLTMDENPWLYILSIFVSFVFFLFLGIVMVLMALI